MITAELDPHQISAPDFQAYCDTYAQSVSDAIKGRDSSDLVITLSSPAYGEEEFTGYENADDLVLGFKRLMESARTHTISDSIARTISITLGEVELIRLLIALEEALV